MRRIRFVKLTKPEFSFVLGCSVILGFCFGILTYKLNNKEVKHETKPIAKVDSIQRKIDSISIERNRIPYVYPDGVRAEYFKNYQKIR